MKYLDYHALLSIMKKLSESQKVALASGKFNESSKDDASNISSDSLVEIYHKLSPTQLNLIKDDYFDQYDLVNMDQSYRARIANHLIRLEEYGHDSTKVYMNNNIVEYNELTVPANIKNSKIWSLVRRFGNICWYTGEECFVNINGRKAWSASEEHLIPESRGGRGLQGNTVIAAKFINNMLENAPLHVKLHIRSVFLKKRDSVIDLSSNRKIRIYKTIIKEVLAQYEVMGRLPWRQAPKNLRQFTGPARHRHYLIEQKFIDRIINENHNIRKLLEEMTDGLEAWYCTAT